MKNVNFDEIAVGINIYELDTPDTPAICAVAPLKWSDLPSDWNDAEDFTMGLLQDLVSDGTSEELIDILQRGFYVAVGYAEESAPRAQYTVSDGVTIVA
jgi:hypothetical protein